MDATNSFMRRITSFLAEHELVLLLFISPFFLFPNRLTPVAVVFLTGLWLSRWITYGYVTRYSPMNPPVIVLAGMALVGYAVSVEPALSNPKLWGIIIQASAFFAALNGLRSKQGLERFAIMMVIITLGVAVVSLLGTNWDVVRLVELPQIYDRIPSLIRNVPDSGLSPTQDLFHPRQVGATMAFLVPFAGAVALVMRNAPLKILAVLAVFMGLVVMGLSQALASMAGLAAAVIFLLVWWRKWLLVPVVLLVVAIAAVMFTERTTIQQFLPNLLSFEDPIGIAVALRIDMWSRAVAMVADMPFTGIGLNTYPIVQTHFYTGYALGPEPHAHNLFLQTAVDLGLPGLVALLWLLVAAFYTILVSKRRVVDPLAQAMMAGVGAGLTAYAVNGVLDTMTLGAKPVIALFLLLGAAGAIYYLTKEVEDAEQKASWPLPTELARWLILVVPLVILGVFVASFPATVATNRALVVAHKAIYEARSQGRPPENIVAAASEVEAGLIADSNNPELHGALGTLLAWHGSYEEALAALRQRAVLDGENPLFTYAIMLWAREQLLAIDENPPALDLFGIYRQWEQRFPDRAELHALVALVGLEMMGEPQLAEEALKRGVDAGSNPKPILSAYADFVAAGSE